MSDINGILGVREAMYRVADAMADLKNVGWRMQRQVLVVGQSMYDYLTQPYYRWPASSSVLPSLVLGYTSEQLMAGYVQGRTLPVDYFYAGSNWNCDITYFAPWPIAVVMRFWLNTARWRLYRFAARIKLLVPRQPGEYYRWRWERV